MGNMPNRWTARDHIWYTYSYSSGNGRELKINPLIPEGHVGRGSPIHKSGKASKPLDRSRPNLAHVYRFIREWTQAKEINPSSPKVNLEVVRGHQFTNVGKKPNSSTDREQTWQRYADQSACEWIQLAKKN